MNEFKYLCHEYDELLDSWEILVAQNKLLFAFLMDKGHVEEWNQYYHERTDD